MKKGEKRKHELLKIAYEMFLRRGYENTSVDEIIAKAQIAKGTFYYYFPSKEQLLEDVIEMMIENETAAAEQIMRLELPAPQKIVATIFRSACECFLLSVMIRLMKGHSPSVIYPFSLTLQKRSSGRKAVQWALLMI